MTVLMHDAVGQLDSEALSSHQRGDLSDVLFADDTLVLGVSAKHVTQLTTAIERCGKDYGLHLHWGKVQLVNARLQVDVFSPDGTALAPKSSLEYLGSVVHQDGRPTTELARRIGMCMRDFSNLSRVWSHAYMSRQRKLEIFNVLIVSRLTYGLSSFWLRTQDQ